MIYQSQYELIREKHGKYASWAVWAEALDQPKSNIVDMAILLIPSCRFKEVVCFSEVCD
jgi:hypothetical protein